MDEILIAVAAFIYALIISVHILVNVLGKKATFWVGAIGVFLHMALLPILVALGMNLEIISLIFISSLFVYLFTSYLFFIKRKGGGSDDV